MLTDIEIAQQTKLRPIAEIAEELHVCPEELEPYGRFKAKLNDDLFKRLENEPDGKLILVTAITPTPAVDPALFADPVPQGLVLTAIVIGFATTALYLVMIIGARGLTGSDHVDGEEPRE